ncbi:MAG: hypothetical protein NVSMB46_01690 [Candidatus Saccharimonadales bacterium]
MLKDRPEFLENFCKQFVNWDDDGKEFISTTALKHSWDIAVWASPKVTIDCVTSFSSTDFRQDLTKFDVPALILHGSNDKMVPFEVSGKRAHEIIVGSEQVLIDGGAHGLTYTQPDKVNEALLNFIKK